MRGVELELADVVRRERLRRDWSVRKAASEGGISNTYWGGFEDYKQPLTPRIVKAVAVAFEWSTNWPIEQTAELAEINPVATAELSQIRDALEAHALQTEELREHVEILVSGILRRLEDVEAWIQGPGDERAQPDQ